MGPYLRDANDRLLIGPARTPAEQDLINKGATSIIHTHTGTFVGVYVDNETGTAPVGSTEQKAQRDAVARLMVQLLPGKQVVVGLFPNEPGHRIPGCVCALEWYPYHLYGWEPPQGEEAYILQWSYVQPGDRPATPLELARLLTLVHGWNPKVLWVY